MPAVTGLICACTRRGRVSTASLVACMSHRNTHEREVQTSGAHLTGNLITELIRYSILRKTRVTGCMCHMLN